MLENIGVGLQCGIHSLGVYASARQCECTFSPDPWRLLVHCTWFDTTDKTTAGSTLDRVKCLRSYNYYPWQWLLAGDAWLTASSVFPLCKKVRSPLLLLFIFFIFSFFFNSENEWRNQRNKCHLDPAPVWAVSRMRVPRYGPASVQRSLDRETVWSSVARSSVCMAEWQWRKKTKNFVTNNSQVKWIKICSNW